MAGFRRSSRTIQRRFRPVSEIWPTCLVLPNPAQCDPRRPSRRRSVVLKCRSAPRALARAVDMPRMAQRGHGPEILVLTSRRPVKGWASYCENPNPNLHCAARVAGARSARLAGYGGMPRCSLRPSQLLHLACTTAARGTADSTRAAVERAARLLEPRGTVRVAVAHPARLPESNGLHRCSLRPFQLLHHCRAVP